MLNFARRVHRRLYTTYNVTASFTDVHHSLVAKIEAKKALSKRDLNHLLHLSTTSQHLSTSIQFLQTWRNKSMPIVYWTERAVIRKALHFNAPSLALHVLSDVSQYGIRATTEEMEEIVDKLTENMTSASEEERDELLDDVFKACALSKAFSHKETRSGLIKACVVADTEEGWTRARQLVVEWSSQGVGVTLDQPLVDALTSKCEGEELVACHAVFNLHK
jgi:hypothetical protein